ncbi:MAG: LysM peptidoglycan-binding domain-containing protein [Phycisphaerales bacterium]|nr:LysM peptidoglycan-binding domain-containing protein [Phycisphaerales bacterium]
MKRCIMMLGVALVWMLPACDNPEQNKSNSPEVRNEEPMPLDSMDSTANEPRYTQAPSNPPPNASNQPIDDGSSDEVMIPRKSSSKSSAKPSARSSGGARTYIVKKGDTLSEIAQKMYGDAGQYKKILNANRKTIKDPKKLRVGQKLIIP